MLFAQVQAPVGATQERTLESIEKLERALPREREGRGRVAVHRAGLQLRRQRPEQRHGVRQAQGLGRARRRGARRRRGRRPRDGGAQPDQGRDGVRVRAAGDARARHVGRLRLLPQGQRRPRPRGAGRGAQPVPRRRGAEPAAGQRAPQRPGRHAAVRASTSTSRRPARSACRSPTSTPRCRRPGAASTSTTSSTAAASSACIMQADAPFRMVPEDFKRWSVRNDAGRDGAVLRVRHLALGLRLAAARALQRRAGDGDQRRGRAGRELGRRDGRGRSGWWRSCRRASASSGPACRTRSAQAGAQTPLLYTLSLLVVFLCLAALYESWSIPTVGAAGRAARHPRRGARRDAARPGARRLLPGGDADHGRPDQQERDPDRRVRQGEPRRAAWS